jgi:hypothetical protein
MLLKDYEIIGIFSGLVEHGCLLYFSKNTYRDLFFTNSDLAVEKIMQIDTTGNRHWYT